MKFSRNLGTTALAASTLIVGLVAGLLLRHVNAGWFEAVGTWVGALVSAAAVVLALMIFRSEDFMRRMEVARHDRAEADARDEEKARVQREADSVVPEAFYAAGNQIGNGMVAAVAIHLYARNNSRSSISNVSVRHLDYLPEWHDIPNAIPPGQTETLTITTYSTFETPEDRKEGTKHLSQSTAIAFTQDAVRWTRVGSQPALRVAD